MMLFFERLVLNDDVIMEFNSDGLEGASITKLLLMSSLHQYLVN